MKLHHRLFASVLILLLSPMAANATLITYRSNTLTGNHYLTAEVEVTGSGPGVYSKSNGGLVNTTLTLFTSSNALVTTTGLRVQGSATYNDYVKLDPAGNLVSWFLYGKTTLNELDPAGLRLFTFNHVSASDGGWSNGPIQRDLADNPSGPPNIVRANNNAGTWSPIPEPGTLALLAIGFGCMYRRRT